MVEPPEPTRLVEPLWLDPYPDALLDGLADTAAGPEARYERSESVALAFVAALQHLPPRQRAALVLRDVLGFHTAEVAVMLDSSEASVKAALQRARATLGERVPAGGRRAPLPRSARELELAGRFAAALERGDADGVVSLLTDDAWLTMPPQPFEYRGGQDLVRRPKPVPALRPATNASRVEACGSETAGSVRFIVAAVKCVSHSTEAIEAFMIASARERGRAGASAAGRRPVRSCPPRALRQARQRASRRV